MSPGELPRIEAAITLLPTQEGGRLTVIELHHPGAHYMPHLVVGDVRQRAAVVDPDGVIRENYLGVKFVRADLALAPGASARVWAELMYHPDVGYEALRPGVTFTVREGSRVVGYGTVLQRIPDCRSAIPREP